MSFSPTNDEWQQSAIFRHADVRLDRQADIVRADKKKRARHSSDDHKMLNDFRHVTLVS